LALPRPLNADARSASLREPASASSPGLPRQATHFALGHLAEGRAPHAREDDTGLTEACVLLATGSWSTHRLQMECLGIRGASQFGRTECVPPRTSLRIISGPSTPGNPLCAWPSRGGAGSARPQGRHRLDRDMCPLGHRLMVNPSAANGMPRHSRGLSIRTHGVRPSEKTSFRAISGFAPGRPSPHRLAISRRGGLRTPSNKASLAPRDRPIGPPGVHLPPMIMLCPGLRPTRIRGRTECVPPRKPPLAPSPGLRRKAIPAGPAPRGGAGSARPRERYWLHPGISPPGCRAIVNGCGGNEMSRSTCSLARRTHGVRPSEKTTPRAISGFPQRGHLTLDRLSRRGGLRTPAREAPA